MTLTVVALGSGWRKLLVLMLLLLLQVGEAACKGSVASPAEQQQVNAAAADAAMLQCSPPRTPLSNK